MKESGMSVTRLFLMTTDGRKKNMTQKENCSRERERERDRDRERKRGRAYTLPSIISRVQIKKCNKNN